MLPHRMPSVLCNVIKVVAEFIVRYANVAAPDAGKEVLTLTLTLTVTGKEVLTLTLTPTVTGKEVDAQEE
jgi:hypothetical protein